MDSKPRSNAAWLADLRASGPAQASALADLRQVILKGLPFALHGYLASDHPEFESLLDEVTQETLLRVLDRLDTFEGRSQFTTWVHKIAIRIALSELRRQRWKDVSLDARLEAEPPGPPEPVDTRANPEVQVERSDLMTRLNRLIQEELTDKQRTALQAVVMQEVPLDVVAQRMGMQRNAVYKLLHDARKRLKQRMETMGMSPQNLLATFEHDTR